MKTFIFCLLLLFSAIMSNATTGVEHNLPPQFDVGDYTIQTPFVINYNIGTLSPQPVAAEDAGTVIISRVFGHSTFGLVRCSRNLQYNYNYNKRPDFPITDYNCPLVIPLERTIPVFQLAPTIYYAIYFSAYGLANTGNN